MPNSSVSRLAITVAIAAALTSPAFSASLYQRTFLEDYGGSDCYGNEYGPAQWKRNPSLKILDIAVRRKAETMSSVKPSTAQLFGVELGISLKSGSEEYRALGDCKPAGNNFACTLESDGGDFRLIRVGRNLRLETRRIQIEGTTKDLDIQSTHKGPTRSFTLYGFAAAPCDFGD